MAEYRIRIPENIEHAKTDVMREVKTLPWQWMDRDRQGRVITQRHKTVFLNLQEGHFWSALAAIDGTATTFDEKLTRDRETTPQERQARRDWANDNFTPFELQHILDICVKTAIAKPFVTHKPGTTTGHSTLYDHLIETPDSMFREAVTPEVEKRLINGRFWEELPRMESHMSRVGFNAVEDVLMNHYEKLDVNLAPMGYQLFEEERLAGGGYENFEMFGLSDEAIDRYQGFFSRVDEEQDRLGLKMEDIAKFVAPLAVVSISTGGTVGEDYHEPRFKRHSKKRSYVRRLHKPLIADYIRSSGTVRSTLAQELALQAVHGNWEHALSVFPHVAEPQEMMDRMAEKIGNPWDLINLTRKAAEAGKPIEDLLGPNSIRMLARHTIGA